MCVCVCVCVYDIYICNLYIYMHIYIDVTCIYANNQVRASSARACVRCLYGMYVCDVCDVCMRRTCAMYACMRCMHAYLHEGMRAYMGTHSAGAWGVYKAYACMHGTATLLLWHACMHATAYACMHATAYACMHATATRLLWHKVGGVGLLISTQV